MVELPAKFLDWTTHIKKMRIGISKGMLPVEEFCSKKFLRKENKSMAQYSAAPTWKRDGKHDWV